MALLDIVYPIGEISDELRYSLRTLVNLPHGNVFMVGNIPKWAKSVYKIPRDQTHKAELQNVNENLKAVIEHPALSEEFYLFNDDFYVLEPVTDIPEYHQGSLKERVEGYWRSSPTQYYSLYKTQQELIRLGRSDLKSFELHIPLKLSKSRLRALYETTELRLFALRPRTLYCNFYNITGTERSDVKERGPHGDFSSTAGTLENPTGTFVTDRFTEKSPYER